MNRKSLGLASALIVLTMLGSGLVVGNLIPAGVQLPIHFGIDGEPDRMAEKWTALLMPAALAGLVSLLFYAMPAIEPKEQGLSRSQGLYLWGWAAVLLIFAIVDLAVISEALGWGIPVNHLVTAGVGAALIMIGNQLGKSRPMFLIGLRTPWTLASEEVWIKTHRLGGKLMVVGGAAMMAAALLPLPSGLLATVAVAAIAVAALIPTVYSYFLWRQEKQQGQPSE
jgi:uncharacterized membrane protein